MEIKRNKKAYFDYEHLETFDAGIELSGAEVKSAKAGLVNFEGSYVRLKNREAWLVNAKIAPYPKAALSQAGYKPDRTRKLLLTVQELAYLTGKLTARGLTVVPLFMYISRRLVKVKIALARGKRTFDKREAIKEREFKRRRAAYGL